jgi:glutamate-5-semialdehyde dehydrogenase
LNKLEKKAELSKKASRVLSTTSPKVKSNVLKYAAKEIKKNTTKIENANKKDLKIAKSKGLDDAMIDRLLLDKSRINAIAKSLNEIAKWPDPVGKIISKTKRPNGLEIQKVSVPIGVLLVIYESRPNVTTDASALCLKSGNSVILKCGSESLNSSKALLACIHESLKKYKLPVSCVELLATSSRKAVADLLKMDEHIDVVVPRGGKSLIKAISKLSKIPVLKHLDGICHTYVDNIPNLSMVRKIVLNAKMRRTGICGATETLLINDKIKSMNVLSILDDLIDAGCEVRVDEYLHKYCLEPYYKKLKKADSKDWDTEYLAPIISVKLVKDVKEAVEHINQHGSNHTDAIITSNKKNAELFLNSIDSSIVMHNTSTQFADGGEFGMGAEIGISTGKLHARGPVGADQLTTFKYVVKGKGQLRS